MELAPQIPALAFSFASCPRAGPDVGVLAFLIPALADDQMDPNASPPDFVDEAPGDFTEDVPEAGFACATGAWTEVK